MRYDKDAIEVLKTTQIILTSVRGNCNLTELTIEHEALAASWQASVCIDQLAVLELARQAVAMLGGKRLISFFDLVRGRKFLLMQDVKNYISFGVPFSVYVKTSNGRYRLADAPKNTASKLMQSQFDEVMPYHGK